MQSSFAEIALELAKRAGQNPNLEGYIAEEKVAKPWSYSLGLTRMALTLSQAWRFHTDYAVRKEPRGKIFELLMKVLETDEVGAGRLIALSEISTLHWGNQRRRLHENTFSRYF